MYSASVSLQNLNTYSTLSNLHSFDDLQNLRTAILRKLHNLRHLLTSRTQPVLNVAEPAFAVTVIG